MSEQHYISKRNALKIALEKADNILKEHAEGIRPAETWNNAHDLRDNIIDRLNDNENSFADYLYNTGKSYTFGNITVIR